MKLSHRMSWQLGLLVAGIVVLAAASLWGVRGLGADLTRALARYRQLRIIYEIGLPAAAARQAMAAGPPRPAAARDALLNADAKFERFAASDFSDDEAMRQAIASTRDVLDRALRSVEGGQAEQAAAVTSINAVLNRVARMAELTRTGIVAVETEAANRQRTTLIVLAVVSGLIVIGAVAIGVRQYRGVVHPLNQLGEGVRRIAQRRFDRPLPVTGDDELAALAVEFNRMADQLDQLYRHLEQKVAETSRQLVRSERLASVGFLAAGVAHEINNPLGVISGHAELARRRPAATDDAELDEALRVIADEAFRGKRIIEKLLSLSRPGEQSRGSISLAAAAEDVAAMVRGLPQHRDKPLTLDLQGPLQVHASDVEIKQVLLNLVVNAMEATAAGGEVGLAGRRIGDTVELSVTDRGRGMTVSQIERVFEPFYTDKRGAGEPGTGLGLSIVHAIVEDHGGRIRATSSGPGEGSRFVIELPAV